VTRPRDLRRGLDAVNVCWVKRRWKCASEGCPRQTFTESVPAVPPRCRVTSRLRELAGAEVAERGCTVAEAARWQQVSWPVAHAAFAGRADQVSAQAPAPVAHLGIDERRRGRARWRADEQAGVCTLLIAPHEHGGVLSAESVQRLGQLAGGGSAADHDQPLRHLPEAGRIPVRPRARLPQPGVSGINGSLPSGMFSQNHVLTSASLR
jgi:transposase